MADKVERVVRVEAYKYSTTEDQKIKTKGKSNSTSTWPESNSGCVSHQPNSISWPYQQCSLDSTF